MKRWYWIRGGLSGNPRLYSPARPNERVAEVDRDGRTFDLYVARGPESVFDAPLHSTHATEEAACAEAERVLGAPAGLSVPVARWANPPVEEAP